MYPTGLLEQNTSAIFFPKKTHPLPYSTMFTYTLLLLIWLPFTLYLPISMSKTLDHMYPNPADAFFWSWMWAIMLLVLSIIITFCLFDLIKSFDTRYLVVANSLPAVNPRSIRNAQRRERRAMQARVDELEEAASNGDIEAQLVLT